MKKSPLPILLLALATSSWVQAQTELVTTKREAALREAPSPTATSLATLPNNTALTRLAARQGAFVQVKTATGVTGWVHVFDVGGVAAQSTAANTATGALRGLSNFFNRGSAQANTATGTSTVGIRGLGAEDIANAQPNMSALAMAERLRQDATQARRFAADATLVARAVEPLPVPAPPSGGKQ